MLNYNTVEKGNVSVINLRRESKRTREENWRRESKRTEVKVKKRKKQENTGEAGSSNQRIW